MRIIVATTPKILIEQLNNFVKMNNLLFFDFYNQILLDSINMEYFVSSEVQFNIKMVNSDFKIDNDKNYVLDFEGNAISVQQVKNNQIDHINITVFTWNPRESIWAKNIGIKLKKYSIIMRLEMLVNNFSAGILGFILAILGFFGIGPIVKVITNALSAGVDVIINAHLLPLANVFIEPAKILFLNNAINHGILTPIATEQALNTGKSVLYLLEANPGVGFGILLAYMFFGKGSAKASAPGAAIIHFIGGIHEIYFPYILMKPALIFAAMAGGVSGTATFQLLGAGLRAPASPGSILAVFAQTATGSYFAVAAGVIVSTLVTFVIASIILKRDKGEGDLESAQSKVSSMKAESKGQDLAADSASETSYADVKRIIFACDAGMGSSAMGASILRNKVKKAGLDYEVTNVAIRNLNEESGLLIVTQNELTPRAKQMNGKALHVSVDNFLNSPKYDEIVENLQK